MPKSIRKTRKGTKKIILVQICQSLLQEYDNFCTFANQMGEPGSNATILCSPLTKRNMSTAIEFNHISKQYRLGLVSTRTLSHDLDRWFQTTVLRREDPYLKIGEVNDRASKGNSEYVWALRDIDFKVEQGDVVGIIGKNGAGKSTLLKLLSKVTAPTMGTIRAKGRIASLLEVGTGFHQEMTGRENIYMNGAILGMTKQEITRKLDEIVDFSGCERYIDTPVKRYSSGMMVRLGFAVAAHLDPEILVVDEVLAVGDAEFQKKAIGKMNDISKGEGRTVLFVSHNMASIRALCNNCILLKNGMVEEIGTSANVISSYLAQNYEMNSVQMQDVFLDSRFKIRDFQFIQHNTVSDSLTQGDPFMLCFKVENLTNFDANFIFNIEVKTEEAESVTCFGNEFQNKPIVIAAQSKLKVLVDIDENLLKQGAYYISPYYLFRYSHGADYVDKYIEFGKRIVVTEPTQLYMQDPAREWLSFPTRPQHGFMSAKIKRIIIEK